MSVSAGIISSVHHLQLCICSGYLWLNADGLFILLSSIRSPNEKNNIMWICNALWRLYVYYTSMNKCLQNLFYPLAIDKHCVHTDGRTVLFVWSKCVASYRPWDCWFSAPCLHQSCLFRNLQKPTCKLK